MRTCHWVALAALVVAAPLTAQQPDSGMHGHMMKHDSTQHGPMRMMGRGGMGPMGPMSGRMGNMAFTPTRLLARNGELQLTAQQITALTAIRDAAERDSRAAMERAKTHLAELKTAMDAAGADTAAIRTHFLAAHDAMGQAQLVMLISDARAKALLTEAQRAQVTAWSERMGHGGWGRPGMRGRGPGAPPAGIDHKPA
ncbi:MAG: hypothetical protein ACHQXA_10590 [Gemmatimonadales bacterium]